MARVASPRVARRTARRGLMPLWASYLVKIYAWRTMLLGNGIVDWLFEPVGLRRPGHRRGALVHRLHLPLAAVHDPADLRRPRAYPESLVEASSDLGGRAGMTFRRVILPLALPGVVAGSIFTFSLTLGDYITPQLVSNRVPRQRIYDTLGVPNLPLAAAIATVPVIAMASTSSSRGGPAPSSRCERVDLRCASGCASRRRSCSRSSTRRSSDRALRVQRQQHPVVADPGLSLRWFERRSRTGRCAARS